MIAKTYTRKSCEGAIRVIVNRDDNGKFCSIQIYPPAKENNCGYSYAFALQDLATFALKRAEGQRDINLIIKAVSGHYCNAMPVNEQKCKSCSDCLASVLKVEFPND
jgi:hypothetical protein